MNADKGQPVLVHGAMMLFSGVFCMAYAGAAVPPPVFEAVTARAIVTQDTAARRFTYAYEVANPAQNNLEIFQLMLDTSSRIPGAPVNIRGPVGWLLADQTASQQALWSSHPRGFQALPGSTISDLRLETDRSPCIRTLTIRPDVFPYIEALSQDPEIGEPDIPEQVEIQERYILKIKTLGPLGVAPGTFEHRNTYESDLAQTAGLGWISDAALLASLR